MQNITLHTDTHTRTHTSMNLSEQRTETACPKNYRAIIWFSSDFFFYRGNMCVYVKRRHVFLFHFHYSTKKPWWDIEEKRKWRKWCRISKSKWSRQRSLIFFPHVLRNGCRSPHRVSNPHLPPCYNCPKISRTTYRKYWSENRFIEPCRVNVVRPKILVKHFLGISWNQ